MMPLLRFVGVVKVFAAALLVLFALAWAFQISQAYGTTDPAYFGHSATEIDVLVAGIAVPLDSLLQLIDGQLQDIATNLTALDTAAIASLYQYP